VGNRARILTLSRALQTLGHELHFAYAPLEIGDANEMRNFFGPERFHVAEYRPTRALAQPFFAHQWRRVRRRLGLNSGHTYRIDDWYDPSLDTFFGNLATSFHFEAVIAEYAFLSRALTCFDQRTTKIVDTHDRFSDRHKMFLNAGQPDGWFSTTLSEELKGLRRADVVVAIEEHERDFFAGQLPGRTVITVGHLANESAPITDWNNRVESSILFVGAKNQPNVAGLQYTIESVLPLVHARHPKAVLLLAGSICASAPDSPFIHKLGYVKDIAELYAKTWIAFNPVHTGSGQSIKSVEALGYSVPLVTTVTGARGLPSSAEAAFLKVADIDAGAMADALVRLLESATERAALSQSASRYVRDYNRLVTSQLISILPRQSAQSASPEPPRAC
jgi:glycosyltransferase involved in cell wall biosynthesis